MACLRGGRSAFFDTQADLMVRRDSYIPASALSLRSRFRL